MATAADWEERFHELVRVSPQDTRGAWALIAECLQDDEELSHSIRRLVRRRRLDDDDCDDVCQQVALSLLQLFRLHPEFGLARRRAGVAPSAWLRGVVRKLARKVIDRSWHRRQAAARLECVDSEPADVDAAHAHGELDMVAVAIFEAARESQQTHDHAVDAAFDLERGLALCSEQTVKVIAAYSIDQRVQTVADELGMSYHAAWCAVRQAKRELARRLGGYDRD
ncbi:MAG TPA: hypothetical protein VGX76_07530, partial [Pirellulales bacterium]|nr:hypothetical protein [Pirellulales bacterium]